MVVSVYSIYYLEITNLYRPKNDILLLSVRENGESLYCDTRSLSLALRQTPWEDRTIP